MKTERELFIDVAKKLGINTELVGTPMGLMFKYGSTRDSFDIWQASAQREGYKLVPIEPTKEMLDIYESYSVAPIGRLSERGYKHMIEAA